MNPEIQAVEVHPDTSIEGMSLADVQTFTKVEADPMPNSGDILDSNLQANPVGSP